MVFRIASASFLIFISTALLFFVKMFWPTSDRFALADVSVADRNMAGRVSAEQPKEVSAAPFVDEHSEIIDPNLSDQDLAGTNTGIAVTAASAALPVTSLDLVLMGVIDAGSRASRAVILSKKDKKQQLYQIGDVVAGAQIKSILWGKVVLRVNGRDEVLGMSEAASYRSREPMGSVSTPAVPAAPSRQEKSFASSEGGDIHDRLIPERVRIALPDQE